MSRAGEPKRARCKTEAALGVARWRAETGALRGAAFYSSFKQHLTLAQVMARVGLIFSLAIHNLTGRDWASMTPDKQRQVIIAILREVPCLLIWDDFESVSGFPKGAASLWTPQEQGELRDFLGDLRGGQTKVILISRRDEAWLGGIYSRVMVGGLVLREAQEMAYSVLRHSGMDASDIGRLPPMNDLLNHLGGNPLAIQAILPELQRMTPDALLTSLQSGEAGVSGDGPTQGPMSPLWTALRYGLRALETTDGLRFSLLGMFLRFVNATALAAFSSSDGAPELLRDLDRDFWVRTLDRVDEGGLVSGVSNGGYVIHPALPYFLRGLLREALAEQRNWLERTYVKVYSTYGDSLVHGLAGHAQEALILLGAEEGNLKHGLSLARQLEQWDDAAGIFRALDRLFDTRARWAERGSLTTEWEGVVADGQGGPLPGREQCWIAVLESRQQNAYRRGDLATAESTLERLLNYYGVVKNDQGIGVCCHQFGLIAYQQRLFKEANVWFLQSLGIKTYLGDESGQASSQHELGLVAMERGLEDVAESWLLKALAIRQRMGDEHGYAYTLQALGLVAERQGLFDRAKDKLLPCLEINRRLGDKDGEATALINLGLVAQLQGRLEDAESLYRQSLVIRVSLDDESSQALLLNQLGRVAYERKRFDEAATWYTDSLALHQALGDVGGQATALSNLGSVAQGRGLLDEAKKWFLKALAVREGVGDDLREAANLIALGFIEQERGNGDKAKKYFDRAQAKTGGVAQPPLPVGGPIPLAHDGT